jgi:hypothetical protein
VPFSATSSSKSLRGAATNSSVPRISSARLPPPITCSSIPIYASATSRHHARIVVAGDVITIEDLGSHNGTYVNGNRVAGVMPLHAGDEIRIGSDCLIVWSRGSETQSLR